MFEIGLRWTTSQAGDDLEANTSAELTLTAGQQCLTRGENRLSRTMTNAARVSAYPMALWLASSWWRIRCEIGRAGTRQLTSWRMAHELTAAGGGYVWPPVSFWSDGEAMRIGLSTIKQGSWEPRRYVAEPGDFPIPREVFDRQVDDFIGLVIARLHDVSTDANDLSRLWDDIRAERADPEVSAWRMMEARLGYDADTASEGIMQAMAGLSAQAGDAAALELASLIGEGERGSLLEHVRAFSHRPGVAASFPPAGPDVDFIGRTPWEHGRSLARAARRRLEIPGGPVPTFVLEDRLGLARRSLDLPPVGEARLALGIRGEDPSKATLLFRRRHPFGRRFEAARFLAEHLAAPTGDRWLPQTDFASARQQRQRAFATEFLVPTDDLLDLIGDNPTDSAIENASEQFEVSTMVIEHHLRNHEA